VLVIVSVYVVILPALLVFTTFKVQEPSIGAFKTIVIVEPTGA
jgi:hypothetical protein